MLQILAILLHPNQHCFNYPAKLLSKGSFSAMILSNLINRIISEIIRPATVLIFVLALVVFGWGVVRYLYGAQGSQDQLTKAKWALLWGVIGMLVLLSFRGIINLLCDFFQTCV